MGYSPYLCVICFRWRYGDDNYISRNQRVDHALRLYRRDYPVERIQECRALSRNGIGEDACDSCLRGPLISIFFAFRHTKQQRSEFWNTGCIGVKDNIKRYLEKSTLLPNDILNIVSSFTICCSVPKDCNLFNDSGFGKHVYYCDAANSSQNDHYDFYAYSKRNAEFRMSRNLNLLLYKYPTLSYCSR